ncbi:MAG TPA: universal stress protein [Rhizomicrobium sp.]|jgi:nucleotide-binding universal stress UspA family protein|nr:universal stress protein [Rhizomicrobium sp.]
MTYRTLMLHLDPNRDNRAVLAVGADLARRFGASVIGLAAIRPAPPLIDGGIYGGAVMVAEATTLDLTQAEADLAACEKEFRAAIKDWTHEIEWRGSIVLEALPTHFADQCRGADLIITGPAPENRLNVGALAVRSGRPILVVPPGATGLTAKNILAAWKDSRESRRAIADALPLLMEADTVVVLEVAGSEGVVAAQKHVDDVVRWLARHGAHALPAALAAANESAALAREIRTRKPDLVVAGAYGHSRMSEWVFGGITRDILLDADCCVLMSH